MEKEYEEYLLGSSLFKGIEEGDVRRILAAAFPACHTYMPGEVLAEERAVLNYFGIVKSGRLAAERHLSTGGMHLVDVYEEGDYFGLDNAATKTRLSPVRITVLEKCEVITFYLEHMMIGIADDVLRDNIISILANENIRKLYKIDILSRAGLRERVMTYLKLQAAKRGQNTFHIGMTQEDFARYLSVNRSALSKELNDMRREGLITFRRDRFTLLK